MNPIATQIDPLQTTLLIMQTDELCCVIPIFCVAKVSNLNWT